MARGEAAVGQTCQDLFFFFFLHHEILAQLWVHPGDTCTSIPAPGPSRNSEAPGGVAGLRTQPSGEGLLCFTARGDGPPGGH